MNLQTHISSELWVAIEPTYEAGTYSHAIVEAMHHLSTVIRDRSGVDGDGAALVGQALGGDSPRLLVNAFQSETDRNIQRGIEQILRGLYSAVRNPRSHEQMKDSQHDADSIIYFVNYLLGFLAASREAFTVERFMATLTDKEFVESSRYAELLVGEVPANRRAEALTELYRSRKSVELKKLRFVISTLISLLTDGQLAQYLAIVCRHTDRTSNAQARAMAEDRRNRTDKN
jgi:uncharacterized protein (TIGR02391 family)